MNKTIIVNLLGGAGCGKSTARAGVYSALSMRGDNVEEVPEWIKQRVYEDNKLVKKDQGYVYCNQRRALCAVTECKSKHFKELVITDSPLLLSIIYDSKHDKDFKQLVLSDFNSFDNINIFIKRGERYDSSGRYNNLEYAKNTDHEIRKLMDEQKIPYYVVDADKDIVDSIIGIIDYERELRRDEE